MSTQYWHSTGLGYNVRVSELPAQLGPTVATSRHNITRLCANLHQGCRHACVFARLQYANQVARKHIDLQRGITAAHEHMVADIAPNLSVVQQTQRHAG